MKNNFTLLFATLAVCMAGFNQNAKAQAVEEGEKMVDVYYGFPNLFTSILKQAYQNSGGSSAQQDFKISGVGPVGGRFEYMFSDKMSVGLEFNFANTSAEWTDTSQVYNSSTGTYVSTRYTYRVSAPRFRVMPRFNIHFGSSEKFDGYFAVAAGYLNTTYKFESNDPNWEEEKAGGLIPFAMRIAVGGKFFVTDFMNIGMEIGIGGGGIIHGGIGFKF